MKMIGVVLILLVAFRTCSLDQQDKVISSFLKDVKEGGHPDTIIYKYISMSDSLAVNEEIALKKMIYTILDEGYKEELYKRDVHKLLIKKYNELKDPLVLNLSPSHAAKYRAVVDGDTILFRVLINEENKLESLSVVIKGKNGYFLTF